MPNGMDLWYPVILESTDIQQAAELNSAKNVEESDVNFHWGTFNSWFWCTTTFKLKASLIQSTLYDYRLDGPAIREPNLEIDD